MSKMIAPTGEGISLSKSVAEASKSANTIQAQNERTAKCAKTAHAALERASLAFFHIQMLVKKTDTAGLSHENIAFLEIISDLSNRNGALADQALDDMDYLLTGGDHA